MSIPVFSENQLIENLKNQKNRFYDEYYAFYSTWFGGITKDPRFMLLPIDDHMVHRGDGVFEAIKTFNRSIYMLDAHLERLFDSADKIAIKPPFSFDQLKSIIIETLQVADKNEAMIRIFLSRGPGNFSVNPYDSVGPQLYIVIHKPHPLPQEKYEKGAIIGKCNVTGKLSWMAQVKSCNYLPNVLMKKEAIDRKLDFVIGVDENENITESATENIMIVDQYGDLVQPELHNILKGITMTRAGELAKQNGLTVRVKPIPFKELQLAREVIITGTTLNVLPVAKFEETVIGNGKPGPVAKQLLELILDDIKNGKNGTSY